MKKQQKLIFLFLAAVLATLMVVGNGVAVAQTFEAIKAQVKEHTLSNGMKILVLERREAPVVSFVTYADVGSVNEVEGITGISHILEHMAFKGTKTIGTKDYKAESENLDTIDKIYDELTREEGVPKPDQAKIEKLKADFEEAKKKAAEYVVVGDYFDMMREQGGMDLNAGTSFDQTQYLSNLPSNKLEFWMAMESDRFLNPVFREFYTERDVIMEERRLGVETRPMGKLIEDILANAFKAHPYQHHVIGHMSDLQKINRKDVENYFSKYYSPSNLTLAVVGDVDANEVFKLAESYFGRIPSGPRPNALRTVEPEQWGERRVEVEAKSQPILFIGYHRPSVKSDEDIAFEGLANILGQGRSSRLYTTLVKEKKIAIQAGSMASFPGKKYPTLIGVYAVPAKDRTAAECLEAVDAEIEKIKNEPVTAMELQKFKRSSKKNLISQMKSNQGMATLLDMNQVILGDWREVFDEYKKIEVLKAEDIQAAAKKYLVHKNRTVGEIVPEK